MPPRKARIDFKSLLPYIRARRKKAASGCLEWQRGKNGYGYGRFAAGKYFLLAHRVVYFAAHQNADQSLFVLHKCDNPSCSNLRHLYLGNQADNNRDMQARRRPLTKESLKRMSLAAKDRWAAGMYDSETFRKAAAARRKTWRLKRSRQMNIHA